MQTIERFINEDTALASVAVETDTLQGVGEKSPVLATPAAFAAGVAGAGAVTGAFAGGFAIGNALGD